MSTPVVPLTGPRGFAPALVIVGGGVLALAAWGLWRDVGWLAQAFYAWAWWGYILMLDGVVAWRRGASLLTTRLRLLPAICVWSVSFWYFFELLNLRFQNWYYVGASVVGDLAGALGVAAFVFFAFSTVFVGIFQTYAGLTALGLLRRWGGRQGRLPVWASYAVQGLGVSMAALAVAFPFYLAPLIWGSFTFLVDPWNYRRGARSVLADFEARRWGFVARVFIAGLVCGLVWESLNFFAPQKWIYTVRGLEEFKLFEMPLLGFLGFPALAFDCLAAWSLVSWLFLGNASWEHPEDLPQPQPQRRPLPRTLRLAMLPLHCFFWMVVTYHADRVNVASLQLTLGDLGTLPQAAVEGLNDRGITRPRQLRNALRDPLRRRVVLEEVALEAAALERLEEEIALYTFKGIGARHGAWLQAVGVRRVADLATWEPESLYRVLAPHARAAHFSPLREDMVRVWVLAARSRGIVMRAKGP